MRKFVISDIHGLCNIYYSVINYLENVRKKEEIELYINGDLFDRGLESAEILFDIKKRIEENKFKIVYLGGNHELLMYEVFEKRKKGLNTYFNDWCDNGGWITDDRLEEKLNDTNKILEVADFVSNLKLYHKFQEKIDNKNILLVHAACPYGYEYNNLDNYLNIDGGCAFYASGRFEYDHCLFVEIKDGYLKILTFNNNNEIIYGNYFINKASIPFDTDELEEERKNLNSNLKVKKLIKLDDGIIDYKKNYIC